jgi:hypothetical protein
MKRILVAILAIVVLSVVGVAVAQLAGFGQFTTVNASTAAPIQITNGVTFCNGFNVYGRKGPRTANTGIVYIGMTSGDDTQTISVAADAEVVITAPPNKFIDLSKWYFDVATANDGVTIVFY